MEVCVSEIGKSWLKFKKYKLLSGENLYSNKEKIYKNSDSLEWWRTMEQQLIKT